MTFAPGAHAQKRAHDLTSCAMRKSVGLKQMLCSAMQTPSRGMLAKTLADAHIQQNLPSDLQRTNRQAAPLAEQLHFKPVAIPLSNVDDLIAAEFRSEKAANILVVWHDATLPKILRALGALKCRPLLIRNTTSSSFSV